MKKLFIALLFVSLFTPLEASVRNVQDNYQFTYTITTSTGAHVSGQTVTLKIKRASDGYWYDFNDNTFKAAAWGSKTVTLTEDTTDKYYYYTFNPPASENGAEEYVFIVDNTDATYGDHQSETVCYQDVGTSTLVAGDVLDATAASYNDAGTIGNKINSASVGDPWSTAVSTTTYPTKETAGNMFYRLWKGLIK